MPKAGRCSSCGLVAGESVNLNFPNTPGCNECGGELEKAIVGTEQEIRSAWG